MQVLAILLAMFLASQAAFASAPSQRVIDDIRAADTLEAQAEKSARAIDAILAVACFEARRQNRPDVSAQICGDWERTYRPMMLRLGTAEGIGDHAPLSAWLAVVCITLKEMLGEFVYEALHLDDLEIMNFGLPVMFDPHAESVWCAETLPTGVACREEYRFHTAPVVSWSLRWLRAVLAAAERFERNFKPIERRAIGECSGDRMQKMRDAVAALKAHMEGG